MNKNAKWIASPVDTGEAAVILQTSFQTEKKIRKATLSVSAMGLYTAYLNGTKAGKAVLTPGWTCYDRRIQYQSYDVTDLVSNENTVKIELGNGWAVGHIAWREKVFAERTAAIAALELVYADGTKETVVTSPEWDAYTSQILHSDIYDGETVDRTAPVTFLGKAVLAEVKARLIPQVGELITEQERLKPVELIHTPKGETILDFGQNMTGYVEVRLTAPRGSRIVMHVGEVLDKDGNFYNENYRKARNEIIYVCSGEEDVFKPSFSFQGFRYVHLVEFPPIEIDLNYFRGIAVNSELKRTGRFRCGNELINQLYHNIVWGQKCNYLDVPTDCPQRDERLGWTGDAQVFCRTAAINFDVERFFQKWLGDMALEQRPNGGIPEFIPTCRPRSDEFRYAAAWADAACVIPWEIYRAYGNEKLLAKHYPMMQKWVEYIHNAGPEEFLWLGGNHYGDWLAMDHGEDSFVGATSTDLIASAYYAYSTSLLIKAGKVLKKDMSAYEALYANVVKAFRTKYLPNGELVQHSDLFEGGQKNPPNETQTAYALILHFGLCEEKDRQRFADRLAEMIRENGGLMTTGFVGTPCLLHVLSDNGHLDLAYELLLQEKTPSWLYSVTHGATTMWEHWNSLKEDGSFWSTRMNSFNHYAYGAVYDWMFGKMIGIETTEHAPAYREVDIAPHPDRRLGFAEASIDSRNGTVRVHWYYKGDVVYYEIEVPEAVTAHLTLPSGYTETLTGGIYHFAE
ncbi:MAG: family 78 glycoside hydrolase catalytic domain [Clostridia bacterium]|nr:family 78 glycoside hydrolase catalytic domain [Clostridia bacterium]